MDQSAHSIETGVGTGFVSPPAWVKSQSHEQAPSEHWAALYNLEQEAKELPNFDGVYEGSPNHANGIAVYKEFTNDSGLTRILLNFPSRSDPCLCIIQVLAQRFPELSFSFGFTNYDSGDSGEALFEDGKLKHLELEEAEWSGGSEDSDW